MIDIADGGANDWIERDGPDGDKVRVFDKQQIGALQWRISKLKPKRYHW
jgi:hypothetical protein